MLRYASSTRRAYRVRVGRERERRKAVRERGTAHPRQRSDDRPFALPLAQGEPVLNDVPSRRVEIDRLGQGNFALLVDIMEFEHPPDLLQRADLEVDVLAGDRRQLIDRLRPPDHAFPGLT